MIQKAKPAAQLASVYETSWENLLMDQSPRIFKPSPAAQPMNAQQKVMPARHQLHIDDTESSMSGTEGDEDGHDDPGEDVCDGAGTQDNSVATDQTVLPTGNSQQLPAAETGAASVVPGGSSAPNDARLWNEDRTTPGRFYPLQFDLSCTRNKFPVTDRRQAAAPMPILRRQVSADADTQTVSSSTKSLAAPIAKPLPVGSLYCEKRLQTAKSEAALGSNVGAGREGGSAATSPAGGGLFQAATSPVATNHDDVPPSLPAPPACLP